MIFYGLYFRVEGGVPSVKTLYWFFFAWIIYSLNKRL